MYYKDEQVNKKARRLSLTIVTTQLYHNKNKDKPFCKQNLEKIKQLFFLKDDLENGLFVLS